MSFETVMYLPELQAQPAEQYAGYLPRSRYAPLMFVPGTLMCGISWLIGGAPRLTDIGFVLFSLACLLLLLNEIIRFPQRYGVGGMIVFGGSLIWLSHDYFSHWLGADFADPTTSFPAVVVAKGAYYNCLFVMLMSCGLLIQRGRWLQRIIMSVPEPHDPQLYFWLMIGMQCIGLSAFILFARGNGLVAIWHVIIGPFTGQGYEWTVGRSGNLNDNWGGYVAQILQVGQTGGVVAAVWAILIARKTTSKIFAWCIWSFWTLYSFSGGRRGEMVFMFLPIAFLLYLKYQALASDHSPRHSGKAYLAAGMVAFVLLVIVQFQGKYRDSAGYAGATLSASDLTKSQGNMMFSEGLQGWAVVPEQVNFFYDSVPGEAIVRVIPDQIFYFLIGPIPRALWHSKPVDPVWEWYNLLVTHDASGRVGTTVSNGLAGHWYFRYGLAGIVEGGLFMGWLLGVAERALQESAGRPMTILLSLGIITWLFRCFRDFIYIDLYGLLIGATVFAILCTIVNRWSAAPVQVVQEY